MVDNLHSSRIFRAYIYLLQHFWTFSYYSKDFSLNPYYAVVKHAETWQV